MTTFITFNIYLFYGLVFFAIGCVVVFRNFKYSHLSISPTLWALALFGFLHAFHEWSELYVLLFSDGVEPQYQRIVDWLKLIKLSLSYSGLVIFAWLLFGIGSVAFTRIGKSLIAILVVGYTLVICFFYFETYLIADSFSEAATFTRFVLGFCGSVLSGFGIAIYGYQLRQDKHQYGKYFIATGVGLCLYGILSGLVPTSFHQTVPIFRTLAGVLVLLSLAQALKIFDIEREQITEAKLKRAIEADKYKAIGHLAMGVAHEVNNPLASSVLALDLLERKMPTGHSELFDYIQRARHGINRASAISKELLMYARTDDNGFSKISVNNVVNGALALMQHRINQYDLTLEIPQDLMLIGQRTKLEELLINLLNNAMDASEFEQEITIKADSLNQSVFLRVIDCGEGMSSESLLRATELFYSTKEIGKGTGLGLAICEQIVRAHSGELTIESTLGYGTTVTIQFNRLGHEND